jgi:hypothetical protein
MNSRQKLSAVTQSAALIACTAGVIKFPHWDVLWIFEFLAVLPLAYTLYTTWADARDRATL